MFPRLKSVPPFGARALTRLLAALAILVASHVAAEAAGTFVPAPARVDMAYDSARDTLYITSGASVLRYHLPTNSFLAPFNLGGSLSGLDLSPDGNTLVVADRTRTEANVWVHVVNLETGESRKANFTRAFMEGGTYTVAYGADNRVLVTSTFEGSGWVPLRRLDPATGEWSDLRSLFNDFPAEVRQDTMLAASGDRSVVGFAESNSSGGPFGRYRVAAPHILRMSGYTYGTSAYNYEIGVNRNGTQYAIPTYRGTYIYDANLLKTPPVIGEYAGPQPIGVAYHPVENLVYFPWTTTTEVRAFDTNTFAQVAAYDFEDTFKGNGNWAFQQGRVKMSRDGSLLFCTVTGGVRFIRLYAPLAAEGRTVSATEDAPSFVTLSAGVGNGGAVSYRVVTHPAHGTLGGTAPDFVYTPDPDYNGPDSFTFKAVYGPAESAPATVSINVEPSNDEPTAHDQSVSTDEDGAAAVTLTASDPDGDELYFQLTGLPQHGTLTGDAPNLVYTPAPDYSGTDRVVFKVRDGWGYSNVATVSISVVAANDAPTAANQTATTNEDAAAAVTLSGSDVDGDALAYVVVSAPARGTLSGTAPNLVYTPAPDFSGADSFTFVVSDGQTLSAAATVSVNVAPVNDAPTAAGDAATTFRNSTVGVAVLANDGDVDGDALTVAAVAPAANGSVAVAPGGKSVTYTPRRNFVGSDSFTYTVSDGRGGTAMATVTVTVRK